MRLLFKLPQQLGSYPHPLAYIEWFTPLHDRDPALGMHKITRSTRNRRRNAAIIGVEDIVEDCHLAAFVRGEIDRAWTSDNVLELGTQFLVNPYIDLGRFLKLL